MRPDKAEVLRYLGHRGQEIAENLDSLIDSAIGECEELANPLYTYRLFPVQEESDAVALEGTTLRLTGDSIQKHLHGAEMAAVLAATLGSPIEGAIRRYEHTDLTRSLILDAAATGCIEAVCDQAEGEIRAKAAESGLSCNFRFSPGYGDLPLDLQPDILEVLQAGKRIGLTCTSSLILLPRKSVTAIIGLFREQPCSGPEKCAACPMRERCPYKN